MRNLNTVSLGSCTNLYSHQQCTNVPLSLYHHQQLLSLDILTSVRCYPFVALICMSLSFSGFFSCAHWPSVCLLWKNVYLDSLPIFKLKLFVLLLLSCLSFYVFWILAPFQINDLQVVFPHLVGFLFILLGRSAGEEIDYPLQYSWTSIVAQLVKNPSAIWETWVWYQCWEDCLEKGKATHSSILAWRIHGLYSPWGHKESDMTEWLSLSLVPTYRATPSPLILLLYKKVSWKSWMK